MSPSDPSAVVLEDLTQLDDISLRQRWRRLMARPMPKGLGRALALRVLTYQQQARVYGDLDAASRRALAEVLQRGSKKAIDAADAIRSSCPVLSKAEMSPMLRSGTMLTREHGGVLHRVVVMEKGFGWNGRTYDSLSKVAVAITGTRWNGPRFFGLREKGELAGGSKARTKRQLGVPAAGASSGATDLEIAL